MAISRVDNQITWDVGSDTKSVAASSTAESDVSTPTTTTGLFEIICKADHAGTPGSGDTVEFRILKSLGDTDGSGGDEYEDPEIAEIIAIVDTDAVDPGQKTSRTFAATIKSFKVHVTNNETVSAMTVSARVAEVQA